MTSWIDGRIRHAATAQLIAWGAGAALFAWWLAGSATLIGESLGEPFAADAAYLGADPPSARTHEVVRVTGTEIRDTGIERRTRKSHYGVQTSAETTTFWALLVGERWLVVESAGRPGLTVVGRLRTIREDLHAELRNITSGEDVGRVFHTEFLATEGHVGEAWARIVLIGGGLLALGGMAVRAGLRLADPRRHPAGRRAARWGAKEDVAQAVAAEARSPSLRVKGLRMGETYLVRDEAFLFDVHRWDELLWAYPQVIRRKVYGVVPAGSSWVAQLEFEDGSCRVPASEADVRRIVAYAAERAPGAAIGHSEKIERAFKRGRSGFRQAMARQGAEPPAPANPRRRARG